MSEEEKEADHFDVEEGYTDKAIRKDNVVMKSINASGAKGNKNIQNESITKVEFTCDGMEFKIFYAYILVHLNIIKTNESIKKIDIL